MALEVDTEKCNACADCANACPVDCIAIDAVAVIDLDECTECGLCVEECSNEALTMM
jgi:NAD-dependent dihydropyrimidine dehydrogenase PreA subunit